MASRAERALVPLADHKSESQAHAFLPSPDCHGADAAQAHAVFLSLEGSLQNSFLPCRDFSGVSPQQQICGVPPKENAGDEAQPHAFFLCPEGEADSRAAVFQQKISEAHASLPCPELEIEGATSEWKPLQIFTEYVCLPPSSVICNSIGKLIEVDVKAYFSSADLQRVQLRHPDLLVEWADGTLAFQMPSSNSTDLASKFDFQITCYLKRYCKSSQFDVRPSSSLFKGPPPNSNLKICADSTIFELTGYTQKIDAAYAQRRTIPEGVPVHVTIEVQSKSQTEEEIRDACRREASLMNCISMAVLIKTGFIEIYGPTGGLLSCQFNPVYIDIGHHCQASRGLRLYMDPLRHSGGWPFPAHPNSYRYEQSTSSALSDLVAAIKVGEFELAKNIINYMECLQDDERPLLEAVKKVTQQQLRWALPFVEYLLDNGARPSQDTRCISAMLVAAAGQDSMVMSLFKQYIPSLSLNVRPDDLVGAVLKKDLELTTLLVRAGCDCNGQDAQGKEPLLVAIGQGNVEAINILIGGRCVLTLEALLLAIDRGRMDVVDALIGGGCVLTPEPLLLAIDRGRVDVVDALIRAGCDPNNQSEDGRLALVEAIPKMQMVNTIINATEHLDIHKQDGRGFSAMRYARNLKMVDIIKVLEEKEKKQGGARKKNNMLQFISKTIFKKKQRER